MLSSSDAILNLSPLLSSALGSPTEVSAQGLLSPSSELLEADGLRLAAPIEWTINVMSAGDDNDFVLEGSVKGMTVAECRRCLTDVETLVEASFVYPMSYSPSDKPLYLDEWGENEDEDTIVFGEPEVDFAVFLTEMLAIAQPITVLCDESCRGLNLEGVNLNEHPELAPDGNAERPARKSPFEALRDVDL